MKEGDRHERHFSWWTPVDDRRKRELAFDLLM